MKKEITLSQKALNLWAIVLIIWSYYRISFKLPEWVDEFIAKPIIFILPVYYFIQRYEPQNFFKALDWKLKSTFKDHLIGFGVGAMFLITALASSLIKNGKVVLFQGKTVETNTIILFIFMAIATAISEEILSRGFILKHLYAESKNVFQASLFASFLFFFLHIPSLFTSSTISGNMLFFVMASDIILSLVSSFLFLERKNLLIPIMIHALYSITLFLFS